MINQQERKLLRYESVLRMLPKQMIANQKSRLKLNERTLSLVHPDNVLKRGYAMLLKDGKVLTSVDQLKKGVEVDLKLRDGIKKTKIIE